MTEPSTHSSTPAPLVEGASAGDIEAQIFNAIAIQLGVPRASVTSAASFEEMGADICDIAELIVLVEDAFGVEIPPDHVDRLLTVGDLIAEVKCRRVEPPSLMRPRPG